MKRNTSSSLQSLAIALALVVMVGSGCGVGVETSVASDGTGAVDFELASLDGGRLGPRDFRGRVVLFDFWATWCSPCHVQADILRSLHREFADRDVDFVAVSVGESESTVRSFVEARPFPYRVLLDPADEVSSRLGVYVLPTVMILDGDGRVRYVRSGISSARRLRRELEDALSS